MSTMLPTDEPHRRPVYRTEYSLLGRQGAFDDEKVELLDGQIVYAAEEGPAHAAVGACLTRILYGGIPEDEGEIRIGNPLAVSELSQPEPDLFVTTPRTSYRAAHPTTATLVVEIADSSRRTDLGLKAVLYAAAGVPDYWVVDLSRELVVVHRRPAGPTFASVVPHRDGVVKPLHHPRVAVDIAVLLG